MMNLTIRRRKYVSRDAMREHSKEGKVDLSFGQQWAPVDTLAIDAGLKSGTRFIFFHRQC